MVFVCTTVYGRGSTLPKKVRAAASVARFSSLEDAARSLRKLGYVFGTYQARAG